LALSFCALRGCGEKSGATDDRKESPHEGCS